MPAWHIHYTKKDRFPLKRWPLSHFHMIEHRWGGVGYNNSYASTKVPWTYFFMSGKSARKLLAKALWHLCFLRTVNLLVSTTEVQYVLKLEFYNAFSYVYINMEEALNLLPAIYFLSLY